MEKDVLQEYVDCHYLAGEDDRDYGLGDEKFAVPIVGKVTVRSVAVEAVEMVVVVVVVVVVVFAVVLEAYDSEVGVEKAVGLETPIEGLEVPGHLLLDTSGGVHLEVGVQRPGVGCR